MSFAHSGGGRRGGAGSPHHFEHARPRIIGGKLILPESDRLAAAAAYNAQFSSTPADAGAAAPRQPAPAGPSNAAPPPPSTAGRIEPEMRGCEGYSPNMAAFAHGGLQSSSTELKGPQSVPRSSTRLHAPPGGASSIVFGGYEEPAPTPAPLQQQQPQPPVPQPPVPTQQQQPPPARAQRSGSGGGGGMFGCCASSPPASREMASEPAGRAHGSRRAGMTARERRAEDKAAAAAAYNAQFIAPAPAPSGGRHTQPPPPPYTGQSAAAAAGLAVGPGPVAPALGQQQREQGSSHGGGGGGVSVGGAPAMSAAARAEPKMRGCEGYSPNMAAFAHGGLQSSSTELKGPQSVPRSSTRLHAPPGGASSIVFG
jgi:hypothetical protein